VALGFALLPFAPLLAARFFGPPLTTTKAATSGKAYGLNRKLDVMAVVGKDWFGMSEYWRILADNQRTMR
jgi:hypothetical protein